MNQQPPNNIPQTPPQGFRPLTDEALNKKFSFSFTRAEVLAIRGPMIRFWKEFGLGDVKVFIDILDKLEPAMILTENDYERPEKQSEPQAAAQPKENVALN